MAASSEPDPAAGRHWVGAFDGARLAAWRRRRGWSQVQLAERLQAARDETGALAAVEAARQIRTLVVQISCYESGRTRPRAQAIRAIALALDVDVLDLLAEHAPVGLATLRARVGLTQDAVADRLGMSRSLYASVEQGHRPLAEDELVVLGQVLQIPVDRLRRLVPVSAETGRA